MRIWATVKIHECKGESVSKRFYAESNCKIWEEVRVQGGGSIFLMVFMQFSEDWMQQKCSGYEEGAKDFVLLVLSVTD